MGLRVTQAMAHLDYCAGDEQFDVYRAMRDHVQGDWQGFHPLTNVMVSFVIITAWNPLFQISLLPTVHSGFIIYLESYSRQRNFVDPGQQPR